MLANSSSNGSLPALNPLSFNTYYKLVMTCWMSKPNVFVCIAFSVTYIVVLLPLCIIILHHGVKQWRQRVSTSSAAPMTHSDCFTYHVVFMELFGVFGCLLNFCGSFNQQFSLMTVGLFLFTFTTVGETFFHNLTCVERYLAVVHPIIYLRLKSERGVRGRNIIIVCGWGLSVVVTGLMRLNEMIMVTNFFTLIVSLLVVIFCSLSVLLFLIRPGPGEQGGGRKRVDPSKQRAFYTIVAILGILLLRLFGDLIWAVLFVSDSSVHCIFMTANLWFNFPSSLALPLLFLHREGKLACGKKSV